MPETSPIKVPIVGKDKLSKKLTAAEKRVQKFQKNIGKMGKSLTRNVTLPLGIAGVASMKFARDLNANMANVATLLTGGLDQVNALKKGVIEMSIATGKSTEDLSLGLYDVVSALGEGEENLKQLGVAAKAARAGVSTTQEAILLLSGTTKGYGDTSEKAMKKVSDLAFKTVKLGVTTFPELAASMGRVTPLAAALNTKQEELFGTMATLTGVTGGAAEASTQMASVYSAMLKPSALLTKTVKKLGYASASAMMKEEGFRGTLIKLNDAFDGNADKLAKALKRKEGLIAALALLGGQSDTYKKKLDEMNNALGATEEAYKKQTEGINKTGFEWDRVKMKIMAFSIKLGDRLLPIMERLFDKLEPWLKKLEGMSDETLDWTIKVGGLAMALGPLMMGLSKLIGVTMAVKTAMNTSAIASAALNTSLAATTTKAAGATKALGLLKAAGPLAAAGAIGVAVGTIIHKTVVEPAAEKKYEEKLSREDLLFRAKMAAKHRGTEENRLKLLEGLRRQEAEEKGPAFGRLSKEAQERQIADIKAARKAIYSAMEAELGVEFETRMPGPVREEKKTIELIHRVKFDNLPPGASIQSPPTPPGVPNTGPILQGT